MPDERTDPTPSTRANDLAVSVADAVDRVVDTVRAKATGPALVAARAAVYGLLAAVLGLMVAILAAIAAVRFVVVYLPSGDDHQPEVWLAHLLVGALFTVAGLLLWRLRRPAADES